MENNRKIPSKFLQGPNWAIGKKVWQPINDDRMRLWVRPLYRATDESRARNETELERHPSLDLPLFPSEASWNGRRSEGLILQLTRPQGIVPSAADSFPCHSVSSDPRSGNGVLRETALSRLLFHALSFLTPSANPALFHQRKMKIIPFCPMSHYPPQLISKKCL